MKRLFCIAGLALILAACGRRGPLVPPEAMVPAPVTTLQVEQKGERFLVSWPLPSREQAGGPLKDLAGFRLFRREVLPSGEDCEECVSAYKLIATVELDYLQGVIRSGNFFTYSDGEPTVGKTYQYKIISFKTDGSESKPSNLARRKRVPPPLPPANVRAAATSTEITISWEPAAAPPKGAITGYLLYRRKGDSPPQQITAIPLPQTAYEDLGLERGAPCRYTVRSVARVEGEVVESDLSGEVTARLAEDD